MSIDESVGDALTDYAIAWRDSKEIDCVKITTRLLDAIEQHAAEVVKREREELLDLVDNFAKNNTDLKDAIRARAGKEMA